MLARKAQRSPETAAPAHKRLHYAAPLPRGAAALVSPRHKASQDDGKLERPNTAQPSYHPNICAGTRRIMEQKRKGEG